MGQRPQQEADPTDAAVLPQPQQFGLAWHDQLSRRVRQWVMFDGEKGRMITDVKDPGNTIMVVEADDDRAVIWTKPDDWQYDPQQPLAGLGRASGRIQCPVCRRLDPVYRQ